MNAEYQYTGVNKPILLDKCMNYVFEKLREYDNNINKGKNVKSPYHNKIIMKTEDNSYVEIPVEIQNEAIQKWHANKNIINKEHKKNKDHNDYDDLDNDEEVEEISSSNYILVLIIMILIGIIGIMYVKHKKIDIIRH